MISVEHLEGAGLEVPFDGEPAAFGVDVHLRLIGLAGFGTARILAGEPVGCVLLFAGEVKENGPDGRGHCGFAVFVGLHHQVYLVLAEDDAFALNAAVAG